MRKLLLVLGVVLSGAYCSTALGQVKTIKITETYYGNKVDTSKVNKCSGECVKVCFKKIMELKPRGTQSTLVDLTEQYDGATYQESHIVDKPLAVVNEELKARTLKLSARHKIEK